jgi:dTMP kinase
MKEAFIVFEGPNGSGKTTIMNAVCSLLESGKVQFYKTKEPTKSELGLFIRNNQDSYSREVLACLIAANRYEHIETVIKPKIEQSHIVISDRYYPSSLVYQRMDGLEIAFIESLNKHILIPNLTIFLTANTLSLKTRLEARSQITRFESDQIQEVQLYHEARILLNEKKWNTIIVDTVLMSIPDIVSIVIDEIKKLGLTSSSF